MERLTAPSSTLRPAPAKSLAREMLNKVPEVTVYFWIIKVLCTTVGETASDYLSDHVGLGLTNTTYITAALLLATLVAQFRARRYIPPIYWLGIVLISVVGTQITDNLTDNHGVSLVTSTAVFSVLLALTFIAWYAVERTLSIHTIFTTRREAFYWLAVLFTFSLGTAAGDLTSEKLNLGYLNALLIFIGLIVVVAVAHFVFGLNAVASFWIAYILTRPLGASIGDYLSQPRADGGLGLGTTVTSFIFLALILATVTYLTLTRKDVSERQTLTQTDLARVLVVANRTAATPALLDAVRARAARGPAVFHLLVPNAAAHAEITDTERERDRTAAEHVLALALPLLDEASGHHAEGSVSIRHDPMDAIEETLHAGQFDEIVLSTLPNNISHWLRLDLPARLAHHGLPVTVVTARGRLPVTATEVPASVA
jgi:uncharacterized membrane-anchored protein